jgi:hypothetical protein
MGKTGASSGHAVAESSRPALALELRNQHTLSSRVSFRLRLLHRENRPKRVDVVVQVKTVFSNLRKSAKAEYPGVVHKNVQFSERGIYLFE